MASQQTSERLRHYSMEDALLLQRSRTLRKLFLDNLAAFTAFDADLNTAFADDWLLSIDECEAHPTDETIKDELSQRTLDIAKASKLCFSTSNGLKYYVDKAFPGDELMLREFGFTERAAVRNNSFKTVVWMIGMLAICDDYDPELTNVGMPHTIKTDMKDAFLDLLLKELEQEIGKRLLVRALRIRILLFNNLYTYATTVHQAAQSVFAEDEERRALFNVG